MDGDLKSPSPGLGLMGRDGLAVSTAEAHSIIIFDVMNVAGLLLNSAILLPALLSPTVSRTTTWMALILSGIFYNFSHLLLAFFPSGQGSDSQPEYGVCLFQASLIYGAPVLTSFAGFAYVLQLYLGMLSMSTRKLSLLRTNIVLLAVPLIASLFVIIESLVVGSKFPDTVTIDSARRYCHMTTHAPRTTAAVLVGIGAVGMIVSEVLLAIYLYRHWIAFRQMAGDRISTLAWHKLGRIAVFTIVPLGAFVLDIAEVFRSSATNDTWHMLIPLSIAIVFGLHMDIIRAWMFWRAPYKKEALWNVYAEPKPLTCNCPHCGKGLYGSSDSGVDIVMHRTSSGSV